MLHAGIIYHRFNDLKTIFLQFLCIFYTILCIFYREASSVQKISLPIWASGKLATKIY